MPDNYSNGRFTLYDEAGDECGLLDDEVATKGPGVYRLDGHKVFSGETKGLDKRGHQVGTVDESRVARLTGGKFLFRIADARDRNPR